MMMWFSMEILSKTAQWDINLMTTKSVGGYETPYKAESENKA